MNVGLLGPVTPVVISPFKIYGREFSVAHNGLSDVVDTMVSMWDLPVFSRACCQVVNCIANAFLLILAVR